MLYYEKKVLNSDGQHVHWFQQNKPSIYWTWKKTMTYDIGNPSSDLEQAHK